MASPAAADRAHQRLGHDLYALAQSDGSLSHPWRRDPQLFAGAGSARNLADAVHFLALLHGRFPGLVDLVAAGGVLGLLHDRIVAGFAAERSWLAQLVVAVGPLPSTAGHAMSEAAVIGQRHAIETLAHSDRQGCSCGALAALLLDWSAVRPVMDAAAVRFGVDPAPAQVPDARLLAATIDAAAVEPRAARAIGFGARQFLLQHRGLWDLLEARAQARLPG